MRTRGKGCDIGYALAANSREGVGYADYASKIWAAVLFLYAKKP